MQKPQIITRSFLRHRFSIPCLLAGGILFIISGLSVCGQDNLNKGIRPYELDWAGRYIDDHVPLVDFEDMKGWTVEANMGSAEICRSEEQKIWGNYTCKIAYRGDTASASFVIRPSESIKISDPFTAVNMWVWNNYWIWKGDRGKPMVKMSILLETNDSQFFEIPFNRDLDWPEWYLLHIRLTADQCKTFANGGIFKGIRISNCRIDKEENIFMDNLSFYQEKLTPIEFEVQPRPGVDLAPGQDMGVHTGEERLPFPTREETILPENVSKNFKTELVKDGDTYIFRYRGNDGVLEYRYSPQRGDLGDVTAQWMDGLSGIIPPMDGGAVKLKINDEVEGLLEERFGTYLPKESITSTPSDMKLIECKISGETLVSRWKVSRVEQIAEVEYVFRIWQKSLVTDIHCTGGEVGEVSMGKVKGALNPSLVQIPYWTGNGEERPAVLVMGQPEKPLFLTVFADYYRTGSSQFYFRNHLEEDGVTCGGGTRYLPRTDGKRNDCHERLFLTISPRFEEILPIIANPPSPWRSVAAQYLICHHGVQDRKSDYNYWKQIARYGMRRIIVFEHEVGWRDAGESFTFRTVAAPGKGGDEGQQEYSRNIQALGLRYGLYNIYTDLAPVNSQWDEDLVTRLPNGGWQKAWFRCYSPKSTRVVSLEPAISEIIQDKFNLSAGSLDVHTAITPWSYVDYDARIPGAGTMLSQFYAYGQLMLHQQKVWNGPAYSEGGNHYFYSGLITGNYACDRGYDLVNDPWLVDFDLRKIHPLVCDVGGGGNYFFALGLGKKATEITDAEWDLYFAMTIAFGHTGQFFNSPGQLNSLTIRSYYMLQQLQSSYCNALIKEIRYANENGDLLDVSAAVATGAYRRNQLRLEYDNGLVVWVNGHRKESWMLPEIDLPPGGYYAHDPGDSLVVFSAIMKGEKTDYVHAPAYDYVDGRGKWVESPWAASDGQLIVLKNEDGSREVIPFKAERFAIALDRKPETTIALDMDGRKLGPAKGELQGRLYYIQPVSGAVSYLLKF